MSFKCSHCGSNRSKKVNGVKVCADCGHSALEEMVVSPNVNAQPKSSASPTQVESTTTETHYSREMGNSTLAFKIMRYGFIVLLLVLIPVVIISITSNVAKSGKSNFTITQSVTTKLKSVDRTHEVGGAWYTIVGTMRNVSSTDYDNLIVLVSYSDVEGVKTYKKNVDYWAKGAFMTFNDDIFVVCAYDGDVLKVRAPNLVELKIMQDGLCLYEKVGGK